MTKRRRRRDPIHSPDRTIHVPPGRIPQSPVPVPRPAAAYREDVDRFWHARLEQGAVNFATVISAFLALPQLRAFWPMSSVDEAENVYDISGQGRTLSPQTNPSFGKQGFTPYVLLNGSHYLSRADEAGLDITGALTLGGWFYHDTGGATQGLISKWIAGGGNDERSYRLNLGSNDIVQFGVSGDGTNNTTASVGTAAAPTGTWFFSTGRYTPSTEIAVWLNTTKTAATSSIPSSIYSGTGDLLLGSINSAGGALLDGRIAYPFLCASALSDDTIAHLYETTRTIFRR